MNATRQQIVDRLRHLIATQLDIDIPPERINLDDGFQSVLGIDSIGFVELRFQCEEAFGIRIDEDEFVPANFLNCEVLSAFVAAKLEASQPDARAAC